MDNDNSILVADVGGTKTLMALYDSSYRLLRERRYENVEYASIESVVADFLEEDETVELAVFGVAAPVFGDRADFTNLGWSVDGATLKGEFNIGEVLLLNDMTASAYALKVLGDADLITLQAGMKNEYGARAIISPGTGLGEALVSVDDDGLHHPLPSEGGHVDFAPSTKEEFRLYEFLSARYGHVSYERVVSGGGIVDIYDFLRSSDEATDLVTAAQVTSEALKEAGDETCKRALDIFVSVLAREAGNLALKGLARGGVYIGGGIAPKIIDLIDSPEFLTAFSAKGRFKGMLLMMPVYLITNSKVVVIGAVEYAKKVLGK